MQYDKIKESDPELYGYIKSELGRQREGLEMIPSENFTSLAVMQASGSVLTNKYSEGYSGKRYYGGNQFIDKVETLAVERAKKLFGVPYANVQPYSGSPANLEIYFAVCKPGDTIMGLDLYDGGHLTHGFKESVTGQAFNSIPYHVKEDGRVDLEELKKVADEKKPKLIWIGYSAYPRTFPFEEFAKIADGCGAYLAADISHITGLIISKDHPDPAKYAHIIMTTTHKTLRGPRGAIIMVTEKGLQKDPELDKKIAKIVFPGMQGGPHNHTTAGIAIALLEASTPEFREYGGQVMRNAKALAEELKAKGLKLVTDGTDTHLILVDLTPFSKGIGIFAQEALDQANITMNKNTIPKDPSSAFYPSGLRMGTPAITTRGMKELEMKQIGGFIYEAIMEIKDCKLPQDKDQRKEYIDSFKAGLKSNQKLAEIRKKVIELSNRFPLYPELDIQ